MADTRAPRVAAVPYAECTQGRTIPITSRRRMKTLAPRADIVTLDAGHSPYLSGPAALAAALAAAAKSAGRVSP